MNNVKSDILDKQEKIAIVDRIPPITKKLCHCGQIVQQCDHQSGSYGMPKVACTDHAEAWKIYQKMSTTVRGAQKQLQGHSAEHCILKKIFHLQQGVLN